MVNARHYYENSQDTLRKREFAKAGELLWGAIAETAKALYLKDYGEPIDSHYGIRDFLNSLSSSYRRTDLKKWKRSADDLHVNFYETHLDEPTFLEMYTDGVKLLEFLTSLLRKSRKRQNLQS